MSTYVKVRFAIPGLILYKGVASDLLKGVFLIPIHMAYPLKKMCCIHLEKLNKKFLFFCFHFQMFCDVYFLLLLKGRKTCFQVWPNILLKNILIHSLINFLSYVDIAVFGAETALEVNKLTIVEHV